LTLSADTQSRVEQVPLVQLVHPSPYASEAAQDLHAPGLLVGMQPVRNSLPAHVVAATTAQFHKSHVTSSSHDTHPAPCCVAHERQVPGVDAAQPTK
jgi:hypothetical protein